MHFCAERSGNQLILSEEEQRHITKVLRKGVGEELEVTDGTGHIFKAKIREVGKKSMTLEISEEINIGTGRGYNIELAIAPTKNAQRYEWLLEKATEIGIDRLVFVNTKRGERSRVNHDRLKRIAIGALKQSRQASLPEIEGPVDFENYVNSATGRCKLIAHCEFDKTSKRIGDYGDQKSFSVLIGPEGDFTPEEIEAARNCGFNEITLGQSILRAETAGLYVVSSLRTLNQ